MGVFAGHACEKQGSPTHAASGHAQSSVRACGDADGGARLTTCMRLEGDADGGARLTTCMRLEGDARRCDDDASPSDSRVRCDGVLLEGALGWHCVPCAVCAVLWCLRGEIVPNMYRLTISALMCGSVS